MQVETILPIWADLRRYRREWFAHDLLAGLGIAAVAIPIGIAYPAIAGLPPVTGLYATIFPLIAYALFGSSRQLVVGSSWRPAGRTSVFRYRARPRPFTQQTVPPPEQNQFSYGLTWDRARASQSRAPKARQVGAARPYRRRRTSGRRRRRNGGRDTNGSENDIRCQVIKRKISGGTRSDTGRDCRDAFLGLTKTCAKLGITFWDYLGARLAIQGQSDLPYLPNIVRHRCATA